MIIRKIEIGGLRVLLIGRWQEARWLFETLRSCPFASVLIRTASMIEDIKSGVMGHNPFDIALHSGHGVVQAPRSRPISGDHLLGGRVSAEDSPKKNVGREPRMRVPVPQPK